MQVGTPSITDVWKIINFFKVIIRKVLEDLPSEFDSFRQAWNLYKVSAASGNSWTDFQKDLRKVDSGTSGSSVTVKEEPSDAYQAVKSGRWKKKLTGQKVKKWFHCDKPYHFKRNCPELKSRKPKNSKSNNGNAFLAQMNCHQPSKPVKQWIVGSGAYMHITRYLKWLSSMKEVEKEFFRIAMDITYRWKESAPSRSCITEGGRNPQQCPDRARVWPCKLNLRGSSRQSWLQNILRRQWSYSESRRQSDTLVDAFLDYYVRTWFDEQNALFSRLVWNHYDNLRPRTMNHLEGWHYTFNREIGKCHPSLYLFLLSLQKHQQYVDDDIIILLNGHPPKSMKRKYREMDGKLTRLRT